MVDHVCMSESNGRGKLCFCEGTLCNDATQNKPKALDSFAIFVSTLYRIIKTFAEDIHGGSSALVRMPISGNQTQMIYSNDMYNINLEIPFCILTWALVYQFFVHCMMSNYLNENTNLSSNSYSMYRNTHCNLSRRRNRIHS